ncbi:MAG: sulfurtransferase [Gemmataceae bacterium]|nr:sulfurtransferase [Gemmataceae bacterium]
MHAIRNIAGYKFAALENLKALRERLAERCKAWQLKGTILLAAEGINWFVAGEADSVDRLLAELRSIPGLDDLQVKISVSDLQPFSRMLVKIKKEIIAFGMDGIDPSRQPAPKISARELKAWLDEGRTFALLDTRNDYEVKLGTFDSALDLGIRHFRDFPDAVRRLPEDLKDRPIVLFCTGGIRCEKAGPFMQLEGFRHVHQLDGGILKYFEEVGGDHYRGECFVFDQRVGLDSSLRETANTQCFACWTPLTEENQRDPRFAEGTSCPFCFVPTDEQRRRALEARQAALCRAVDPLPGGEPYDNYRPVKTPAACDGRMLLDMLSDIFPHLPREHWRTLCDRGKFLNSDRQRVGPDHIVRAGDLFLHHLPNTREPDVNAGIRLVHEDEAMIVVDKPAPLPTHPSGRFNRNTLAYILAQVYGQQKPRPAHRLDANTTGLIVFARTAHFAKLLQPQFEAGAVEKIYLARVLGHPPEDAFSSTAPIRATAGVLGGRDVDAQGLPAQTDFRVRRRDPDGTALLEVRPRTGRTNQIRVHLWELGWPILGDPAYLPNRKTGDTQTIAVDAPPLYLHAWRLAFAHPITKERVAFEARPSWREGFVSVTA